jgi:hypothetical protein
MGGAYSASLWTVETLLGPLQTRRHKIQRKRRRHGRLRWDGRGGSQARDLFFGKHHLPRLLPPPRPLPLPHRRLCPLRQARLHVLRRRRFGSDPRRNVGCGAPLRRTRARRNCPCARRCFSRCSAPPCPPCTRCSRPVSPGRLRRRRRASGPARLRLHGRRAARRRRSRLASTALSRRGAGGPENHAEGGSVRGRVRGREKEHPAQLARVRVRTLHQPPGPAQTTPPPPYFACSFALRPPP